MVSSVSMDRLEKKSFTKPDEVHTSVSTKTETVSLGGVPVAKITFEPGWKSKRQGATESCQMRHFGYQEKGRLHVVSDDGKEMDIEPGDLVDIPPGHNGWVVGDEEAVFYDFGQLRREKK
ncbi:MAG: cupin domain-containing protein [Thaumarchaeota archaeon]|nr:cupin domain-containing protein [Nitrososphaerota archaeon]MCL5318503.1 cupin domain-containing protein [Nitrososphaerota archaeon]